MTDVLPVLLATAGIFLLVGLPIALAMRSTDDGWSAVVVDALVQGLVVTVLGIVLQLWTGWLGVGVLAALWLAVLAYAVLRKRPLLPRPQLPRGRDRLFVGAWAAVLVLTVVLRLRNSNFLPWVGDMGAYVNWANEYVAIGQLKASWPPFFPAYLAMSAELFGTALTTAAVPLTGILLVLVIARVARQFGAGRWAALATAFLVSVSAQAIWFSSFPASESLNAPLFIAWLGTLLGLVRSPRAEAPLWAGLVGIDMLALGLLRGTAAILLVPLLVLAVLTLVIRAWRPMAIRVWIALTVALAAAFIGYWYGISRIAGYYVNIQIRDLMPAPVFRLAEQLGLFQPTIVTALALIVVTAAIGTAGLLLARRYAPHPGESRSPRVLSAVLASALAAGVLADAIVNAEVWHVLLRAGLWLTLAGIATLFVLGWVRLPADATGLLMFAGTAVAVFLAIHTVRLKVERGHSFHFYWDRYLFSEILPALFLLFAVGATILWRARIDPVLASERPILRALPAIGVLVALVLAVVPTADAVRLVTKDAYLRGAYEFEQQLIDLLPDRTTPIVWAATRPVQAEGFFFPNTYMAFAKPMMRTFRYDVLNISDRGSDFSPDEVFTARTLTQEASCAGTSSLVLFEVDTGGRDFDERVDVDGIDLEPLGSVTSEIRLLAQPAVDGDWTTAEIPVTAWLVRFSPEELDRFACPA